MARKKKQKTTRELLDEIAKRLDELERQQRPQKRLPPYVPTIDPPPYTDGGVHPWKRPTPYWPEKPWGDRPFRGPFLGVIL